MILNRTRNRILNLVMFKVRTNSSVDNVNALILKITCLFALSVKLIGWRMFTTHRLFPTAPVFEWLNGIPSFIDTSLFYIDVLLIIFLLFSGINRVLLSGVLIIELFSCLLDQNRWQPWEYQYLFTVFIFIINAGRPKLIPVAISFILAFTYIYSGAWKLNQNFLHVTWSGTILQHFFKIPSRFVFNRWVFHMGYLLGMTELLAGLGLLFLKTSKKAAVVLILMHLFVLLLLSIFGLKLNVVVWPWSVAMILYLYFIFLNKAERQGIFPTMFTGWNKLVVLCWGVLPALSFVGYWDYYLSSSLYSGKLPTMIVCISDTTKCRQLSGYFYKNTVSTPCDGQAIINMGNWATAETNVAIYPELRVYKILAKKLQKRYPLAGLHFVYY